MRRASQRHAQLIVPVVPALPIAGSGGGHAWTLLAMEMGHRFKFRIGPADRLTSYGACRPTASLATQSPKSVDIFHAEEIAFGRLHNSHTRECTPVLSLCR
jgi:hypothetical protein